MWRHTRVIYVGEDGEDAGGLTADLHASFWREVLEPKYGLFERLAEGGAHLPRSDADRDALRRVGRVLLKSILDDHPTGPALSSFVLECICGAHESRAFRNERPRDALRLLATCDSELARRWTALLTTSNDELVAFGLSLNDFDDTLPVEPLSAANVGRAVVAGCRRKLLVDRHDAVVALREGFTLEGRLDLGVQLAQHSNAELSLLLQGKPSLSTVELLECFDWSEPCCAAVTYLMDLLSDAEAFDVARRQLLLRWCTGRDVLPVSGFTNKVTFAAAEMMRGELPDGRLPEACTCFYEVRLPNYSSKEMLRERLEHALNEFAVQGGFGRQ
jgi:E3 ubiquitin-protein ligase HUWE1